MEVVILRGPSGSGKSTWASAYKAEHEKTIVVNRDSIRKLLFGSEADFGLDEDLVTLIERNVVKHALLREYNLVIDNTHVYYEHLRSIVDFVKYIEPDAAVRVVSMDTPINECKRRNAVRWRVVPEKVIDRQFSEYEKTKDYIV